MKQATKKILDAALELPDKEKIQVVEELLVGIEGEPDPDAEAAWANEIARRTHEIEQGTVKPVPWLKVKKLAAERLRGTR
jgi:putative addiction module component (TIGR02574 family)